MNAQEQIIIQTAAMLIINDIKENVSTAKEFYPSPEDLTSENCINYLPRSLYIFLNKIATGTKKEKKVVAIGQVLIQACRPRSIIAPIQIGLAAQLHHLYSSRFLIDVLNSLSFCSSYSEVMQLLKDASLHGCKDICELLSSKTAGDLKTMFAADNVDHNICTLTGSDTFHGMGMIAISNKPGLLSSAGPIRCKQIHLKDILDRAAVKIKDYYVSSQNDANALFKLKVVPNLNFVPSALDTLWHCSYFFPSPLWSGFMNILHENYENPTKSSISFLPIIDLSASNMNCMYSTLRYTNKIACSINQPHIIALDQPLHYKSSFIVETNKSEFSNTVVLLGSFHTTMNFLGAIGYIIDGSGI